MLDRFEQRVAPELARVRAQVVHNDLAPTNVLVDDTLAVTGITDFGDMTHTALICDLAVATADVLSGRDDALELAHEVLSGYAATTPLEPQEVGLLADLMAGRYAACVLITAWRTQQLGSAPQIDEEAYDQLEAMLDVGLDTLTARFTTASADGPTSPPYRGRGLPYRRRPTTELLRARSQVLGGLEVSYAQPVHLVGGRGMFLEGADGRRYLDAYNNVPVLGHSHPAVVDAVCSQLATLNTNSRYLQEAPVELAEQLLATLPARFDRVLLVNSGSEANDLAWRIARHATGATGGIVTSWAYHGVTEATFAFSPGELGRQSAPATHAAGGASARLTDCGDLGGGEPRRQRPRRGGHVRRRCVHQRRHPRAGSRVDRRGRRRGARGGRTVRRGRGAGRARADRRCPVELRGRPGAG